MLPIIKNFLFFEQNLKARLLMSKKYLSEYNNRVESSLTNKPSEYWKYT